MTGSRAGTPSPSAGGRPHSGNGRWLEENNLGRKSSCRQGSRAPLSPVWMTRLRGPAPGCRTRPPTHWTGSKLGEKGQAAKVQFMTESLFTWSTILIRQAATS